MLRWGYVLAALTCTLIVAGALRAPAQEPTPEPTPSPDPVPQDPPPTDSAVRFAGKGKAPCRYQYRDGDRWSHRLVDRRFVRENLHLDYRKAPNRRRLVPRFIGCLARRFGISVRRLLATAWCECKFYLDDRSGPHYGPLQFQRGWGPIDKLVRAWWAVKRAARYISRHGWWPWTCRDRWYVPRWGLRAARAT